MLFLLCKWTRYCSADKWMNGPWQERSRVPGMKVPGNERSRERMVLGGKGLQCLFVSGTNGPGNECSRERIVLRTKVPSWERIVLGTNIPAFYIFINSVQLNPLKNELNSSQPMVWLVWTQTNQSQPNNNCWPNTVIGNTQGERLYWILFCNFHHFFSRDLTQTAF